MAKCYQYVLWFRAIQKSLLAKIFLPLWTVASIYDLLFSQFIPEKFSKQVPKAWEVAIMTGNLLPFWGWLLILAGILIMASFEWGIRQRILPPPITGKETLGHPSSTEKQGISYVIADCTFDIILEISEPDLKILQTSSDIENGSLLASVDIFEKDISWKTIHMTIMGEWHGLGGRIHESLDNLTMFNLPDRRFMFMAKKPSLVGNAHPAMTRLFSNKKYIIQIRAVPTLASILLIPINAMIRTHEGVVFPATEFKRLDGTLSEYWQAECPSVPIIQ